jgi:hypothetical protein
MGRLLLVLPVAALVLSPLTAHAQYYPYGYYPPQYYYRPPPPPPPAYMYQTPPPAYAQPYYNAPAQPYYNAPPAYNSANCGTPDEPKPCYR